MCNHFKSEYDASPCHDCERDMDYLRKVDIFVKRVQRAAEWPRASADSIRNELRMALTEFKQPGKP